MELGQSLHLEDLGEVFSSVLQKVDGPTLGNLRLTSRSICELVESSSVVLKPRRSITSEQLVALYSLFPNAAELHLLGGHKLAPSLPHGIARFSELKVLSIKNYSTLIALPWTLGSMSSLLTLDVSGVSLPETLGGLHHLKELSLCNIGAQLPESIGRLTNLEKFALSYVTFSGLPESLGSLFRLKELKVQSSSLLTLPNSIVRLTNLVKLELLICDSLKLPESMGDLINLESFFYTSHEGGDQDPPIEIPESIWDLVKLKRVSLSGVLRAAPERLADLVNLQYLNLGCNSFISLPDSLGRLGLLEEFELDYCSELVDLPESLGRLRNLKNLNLTECSSLTALPKSFGLLTNLEILDLSECNALASLPESFSGLRALSSLDLAGCTSLHALPLAVWRLDLSYLNVSRCHFTSEGRRMIASQNE